MSPGRVLLHIGLPKTGTTYLQQVVWANRDRLASDGVLLPGFGHREHLWAALDLQERPRLDKRHPDAPGSWDRLVDQARAQSRDVLLTHEFFCGASAEQATRAIEAFPDSEVHLVVTARDAASVVIGRLAGVGEERWHRRPRAVLAGKPAGGPEFSMRTWDLAGVLERWTAGLPSDRVHVLVDARAAGSRTTSTGATSPRCSGSTRTRTTCPPTRSTPRSGIVQIEMLRQVNAHLPAYSPATGASGSAATSPRTCSPASRGSAARCRRSTWPGSPSSTEAVDRDPPSAASTSSGTCPRLAPEESASTGGREPGTVSAAELVESAARSCADIVADVRAATGDVPPRVREKS